MRWIWGMVLALVSGCSLLDAFGAAENPNVDGPGTLDADSDGTACGACQLIALSPSIAGVGDRIALEGTFGANTTVMFPGGIAQSPDAGGSHRIIVTVPIGAVSGDLTVVSDGVTLGPLGFTFASDLDLQAFGGASGGLTTERKAGAVIAIGNRVYVVGGFTLNPTGYSDSIETATTDVSGMTGAFAVVPSVTLEIARSSPSMARIHGFVYVVGGFGDARYLDSIERAPIAGDGTLGDFAVLPGVTLRTPRSGAHVVIVGDSLLVIGGAAESGALDDVERATINTDGTITNLEVLEGARLTAPRYQGTAEVAVSSLFIVGGYVGGPGSSTIESVPIAVDGSLGTFATSGASLETARAVHTSVVAGNFIYVMGGSDLGASFSSIERATIFQDGSLGAFSTTSGTLATPRQLHMSTIAGKILYVVGGETGTNTGLASVERASLSP